MYAKFSKLLVKYNNPENNVCVKNEKVKTDLKSRRIKKTKRKS